MKDIHREYINPIKRLLELFPCVAIIGARQVGKTTLLKQVWPDKPFFDLEKTRDYELVTADPFLFLDNQKTPVLIDEAQLSPELFRALRVKIDGNRKQNGQVLISGSSSPDLLQNISESLAGRVAILELGGFLWNEALGRPPSPIYSMLTERKFDEIFNLKPLSACDDLYELCLYGGYPELYLRRQEPNFPQLWLENYVQTYINRDIRRLFPGLNMENYQRFIKMMAISSGNIINYSNFAKSLDVSQPTSKQYFHIAEGTFIWRKLPAWHQSGTKRLIKMPRGYLRDTGLLHFFKNISTVEAMRSHPDFGFIWESFITEQIIKSFKLSLTKSEFYYYRTADQSEVDLIIDLEGKIIPIEIKTGLFRGKKQIQGLINFVNHYHCDLGILINTDVEVMKITDRIIQIPAAYW
jgi:uncharacterized protein